MDDLVRWLGEQLDEDQRIAEAARGQGEGRWHHETSYPNGYVYDGGVQPVVYDESAPSPEEAEHIAAHDPARVLREIDAKRATIADYEKAIRTRDRLEPNTSGYRHWDNRALGLLHALRHAAAVYADRPGYAEMLASAKAALLADE